MTLNIYSYCNYKDSSVGFQIGKVNPENGKIFRTDSIPKYIIRSFESGSVNMVYGRYPDKNNIKYCFLLKRIEYIDNFPEPDKYMNVALECSDLITYKKIKHYFQLKTSDQISELFGNMVFKDTSNSEYEMVFDVNKLSLFMNQIDNETVVIEENKNYDYFLIASPYEGKESELKDLFLLNKFGYVLYKGKPEKKDLQYLYRFVKKKIWMILIAITIIVTFLMVLFLALRN